MGLVVTPFALFSKNFIAEILSSPDTEHLADLLRDRIAKDTCLSKILARYLRCIIVKIVHLKDFKPTKTKVEKADIELLVKEFRSFLETAIAAGDEKIIHLFWKSSNPKT